MKTVYVAIDGMTFDDKEECEKYEKEFKKNHQSHFVVECDLNVDDGYIRYDKILIISLYNYTDIPDECWINQFLSERYGHPLVCRTIINKIVYAYAYYITKCPSLPNVDDYKNFKVVKFEIEPGVKFHSLINVTKEETMS